jgi:hypothetical protein
MVDVQKWVPEYKKIREGDKAFISWKWVDNQTYFLEVWHVPRLQECVQISFRTGNIRCLNLGTKTYSLTMSIADFERKLTDSYSADMPKKWDLENGIISNDPTFTQALYDFMLQQWAFAPVDGTFWTVSSVWNEVTRITQ